MPEIFYGEHDENESFGFTDTPIIVSDPIAILGGTVLFEMFCSNADANNSVPGAQFQAIADPTVGSDVTVFFDGMDSGTLIENLPLYSQWVTELDAGTYTFSLLARGSIFCEPPLLPTWFRVVANPFAVTSLRASINHAFGLG